MAPLVPPFDLPDLVRRNKQAAIKAALATHPDEMLAAVLEVIQQNEKRKEELARMADVDYELHEARKRNTEVEPDKGTLVGFVV
jgi:hypothetical protein